MSLRALFSRVLPLSLVAATVGACYIGGSDGVTIEPMELVTADWNLSKSDMGTIHTAVDLDDQLVVFSDKGMFVLSGGVVSAADNTVTSWSTSTAIPAADGNGTWAVGVVQDPKHADPNDGKVYRVYAASKLDAISDRYGLLGTKVLGVARASSPEAPGAVAFALDGGSVAYTDGVDVNRYDVPMVQIVASGWRVAGIAPDGAVATIDLNPKVKTHDGKAAKITIDGVRSTAFDGDRLVILTENALYRERADRTWDLIFSGDSLHGLVATPNGVWFGSGSSLCLYDGALQCASANLDPSAVLIGSARGVYAIEQGKMRALERKASGAEALWRSAVRPVFARVCSSCHARGGSSGIDLSAYKSWAGLVGPIEERVLVKKNMPTNQTLAGTDYQIIQDWVSCQKDVTKCPAQ